MTEQPVEITGIPEQLKDITDSATQWVEKVATTTWAMSKIGLQTIPGAAFGVAGAYVLPKLGLSESNEAPESNLPAKD